MLFMLLEILGAIFLFGMLSFFSLILFPSIFGCMSILFVCAILGGAFLFVSTNFITVLAIILALYAWGLWNKFAKYKKLPTYDEFIATSNHYINNNGAPTCSNCGFNNASNIGLFGPKSKYRYYVCSACSTPLYRFKVI